MVIFVPKSGAVVDFVGLESIAQQSAGLLKAQSGLRWHTDKGYVFDGLEPNGKRPKKTGPPGVMQFSIQNFTLSPGFAIVPTEDGGRYVVHIAEPEMIQLEEPQQAKNKRALVLKVHTSPGSSGIKNVANDIVRPLVLVVDQAHVRLDSMVVLANELAPNIWATDVQRLVQPSDTLVQSILGHLNTLEDVVWESDRHGDAWNVQRLGREWKTYQSKASVAITGARMALAGRPSTTDDRVRCLTNLHWQLLRSVELGAQSLTKWMGVVEAADVYASIFSAAPADWDEM